MVVAYDVISHESLGLSGLSFSMSCGKSTCVKRKKPAVSKNWLCRHQKWKLVTISRELREKDRSAFTLFWYLSIIYILFKGFPLKGGHSEIRDDCHKLENLFSDWVIERVIKIEERGEILTRGDLDSLLLAGGDESLRVFVGAILQENIVTSDGAIVSGWCPALN